MKNHDSNLSNELLYTIMILGLIILLECLCLHSCIL